MRRLCSNRVGRKDGYSTNGQGRQVGDSKYQERGTVQAEQVPIEFP